MRIQERGIGNLPFIAVLVLFVIAVGLFFMARSEADTEKSRRQQAEATASDQRAQLVAAQNAYEAWREVSGLKDQALQLAGDQYPEPDVIRNTVRKWMADRANAIKAKSAAVVQERNYQIQAGSPVVKVIHGDKTTIELYGTAVAQETMTFQNLIAPLDQQFEFAANLIKTYNELFESEFAKYNDNLNQLKTQVNEAQGQYQSDVQSKAQQYDTEKQRADQLSDQVNGLQARIDAVLSTSSTNKAAFEREVRILKREIQALKNRLAGIKQVQQLAVKEDPKDGEVLYADARKGLVFINRGRDFRVSRGTKFSVWRTGKGGAREDIAVIRVIKVDDTWSTCNILKQEDRRIPVAQGQNISNPFYDPHEKLVVYIYGDLRYYPSDVAKRRLAESGAVVANTLDHNVDVIVLGEPPVTVAAEDMEDEEGLATAQARASAERERRLRDIKETAVTIGAVVVTEEVLRTFIEY